MHSVPVRQRYGPLAGRKDTGSCQSKRASSEGLWRGAQKNSRAESGLLEADCGVPETSSGVHGVCPLLLSLSLYSSDLSFRGGAYRVCSDS